MNVLTTRGIITFRGFFYALHMRFLVACCGTFIAPTVQMRWQMERYASISFSECQELGRVDKVARPVDKKIDFPLGSNS